MIQLYGMYIKSELQPSGFAVKLDNKELFGDHTIVR
jgi:hypothetical protein